MLQENVYTETQGMIPDTESRLRSALVELETEMVRLLHFFSARSTRSAANLRYLLVFSWLRKQATPAFDGTAEQKSAKEEVESAKEALAKRAAN